MFLQAATVVPANRSPLTDKDKRSWRIADFYFTNVFWDDIFSSDIQIYVWH